jgi:Tfp pilus assembly protein PilV
MRELMKNPIGIKTRLVSVMLVTVAVIGLSAFAVHTPAQNQNSLARSLKSIQTDKATMFYANARPDCAWFVEQVLPGTSGSKAATENLKSIAAAL